MAFRRSGVAERVGGDLLDPAQDEVVTGVWAFPEGLTVDGQGVLTLFNVKDYVAADDIAQAQSALDAAIAAGGGIVYFPPGDYDWSGVAGGLKLRRNLAVDVQIVVWGPAAKIVLSSTTQQFVSFDRQADYDVFRNYTIDGFTVDAGAVSVTDSSIKYVIGGSHSRVSYDNLTFRNITINDLQTVTGASPTGWTAALSCKFSGDGTEGQTVGATNILFEDCTVNGGNNGFEVAGYLSGTTSPFPTGWVDEITWSGCHHDTEHVPTAFHTSENFLVGGSAVGGRATFRDCTGRNASDVGIEMDSMQHVTLDNCLIVDAYISGYFVANMSDPTDSQASVISHNNCVARREQVPTMKGFRCNSVNSKVIGRLHYDSCTYESLTSALPTNSNIHGWEFSGTLREVRMRSCVAITSGFTHVAGTSTNPRVVNWFAAAPTEGPSTLDIDGLTVRVAGSVASSGTWNMYGITVGGGCDVFLSVRDLTLDDSALTRAGSVGSVWGIELGATVGATTIRGGSLDGANIQSLTRGAVIRVFGTGTLTFSSLFRIRNVDTSHVTGSGAMTNAVAYPENLNKLIIETGNDPVSIPNPTPARQGLLAWSIDPNMAATSALLVAGVISLVRIPISETTISNLMFQIGTAGSGLTTGNYVGLYDSTGAKIAESADITTGVWDSTGVKTVALVTPVTVSGGITSWIYAAFLANGSTAPRPACAATLSASTANLNVGASAGYRTGTSGTGQTTLPSSITLNAMSSSPNTWVVGVK